MFTSGSTGRSKGVVLPHAATLFTIDNLIERLAYSSAERELITLPISHSFGLGHVYCNLFSGGAVRLEQGLLNLKRVFAGLTDFHPTGFPGTPQGFGMLIDRTGPLLAKSGAGLRFIVIDSAPMPRERTAQLQALLPDTEIFFYYGLTEASRSTLISLTNAPAELRDSVGPAMPGVEIALAAETSEVLIRGPHLAAGYWRDPELTRATMGDGWLRTGDIGRLDEQSNLFIVGRLKELINVGGHKVDPAEVDAVIAGSGLVQDAATCGLPTASGEVVACAVVSEGPIDETALVEACAGRLEGYKIPTLWFQVAEIPRTETGKTKRQALAADLAAAVAKATP
jgi:long-chain acyl-CoA synthetase